MQKRRHPLENTNPTLETDTLIEDFEAPILLITYDGIRKVTPKQIETYEIHMKDRFLCQCAVRHFKPALDFNWFVVTERIDNRSIGYRQIFIG